MMKKSFVLMASIFALFILSIAGVDRAHADTWIPCAAENQQCSFSGNALVRYGGNGVYFTQNISGGTLCANSIFGDPDLNVAKSCDYQPQPLVPSWVYCADEGQQCLFSGTTQVRFGAEGKYNFENATGSISCTDAVFGDPDKNALKRCYYLNTPVAAAGTTWYVRPDGGTRFSSNVPMGQCNGKADLPYLGTGVNQDCAFKDVRFLWSDATYTYGMVFPGWGWIGAGGDTYIIRGSIGSGNSYRVGWNSRNYCDTTGCWGITGDSGSSGAPTPPSGTADRHTRILGENYQNCHAPSAKTQLHGGWGANWVLSLSRASYVDVACLDITDFSACGRASQSVACDSTQDFAATGIGMSNATTNVTLTDLHIHGLANAGIFGATGDGVVLDYVDIVGNASAGWNADSGNGTTGVGSLNVSHYNISGNGCAEEYPIVDSMPYGDCTDQDHGGYGDGFGTSTVDSVAPGWQVHFDQGVVSYNTQDGLDALHISGSGSTVTVTRTLAYGNMGQQIKVGGAAPTLINNLIVGNCSAMAQPIPGFPSGFNSKLDLFCRAGDTAVFITAPPSAPAIYEFNTLFSPNHVGLEVEYPGTETGTETIHYNNNVFVGFMNGDGQSSTPIYSNSDLKMFTNPGASFSNNSTYHQKSNFPCPFPGESHAVCGDPGLVDETLHTYGFGNMSPTSTGAVVGAGLSIPGVPINYLGQTRTSPPNIGAY